MKIKSLDMINFGKFTNYHIDFEPEFNLIYGLNESGKSTVHSFISFMLFGVNKQNTKRKTKIKDYLRYKPLNKNEYNGRLIFEKDGAIYEIYRDFLNDTYYVSKNGLDISENIKNETSKNNKSIGEIILGFSRNVFLTSSYISQAKDVYFDDFDDVKDLLFKLKTDDEDSCNINDAINNISGELSYIGSENSKTKELYQIKNELSSIDRDISNAEISLENTMDILNRKQDLQRRKIYLETLLKDFQNHYSDAKNYYKEENLTKIAELKKKKAEFSDDSCDIKKEDYERFTKINNELENYEAKKNSGKALKIFAYAFVLLAIIGVLYYFFTNERLGFYAALASVFAFVATILLSKNKEKSKKDINNIEKLLNEKKNILNKYSVKSDLDFTTLYTDSAKSEMRRKYIKSMDDFIKSYDEKNFDDFSDEKVITYLEKKNTQEYEKFKNFSLKTKNDEIKNLELELKELETKLNYNDKVSQRIYELNLRRDSLETRRDELERRKRALKSANEILLALLDEINTSYMPKIIKEANKYLSMFSSNKYNFFLLDDNFKLMLKNNLTQVVYEEENLSRQVLSISYLSLRLAIIDVLSIELPLIFDENLVYFDSERLKLAIKIFALLAKEKQVLLFTSSKDEKSVLSELNLCYNYIQL